VRVRAIVTALPYAQFLPELAAHPLVSGLRLNTVMPLAEPPRDALARLAALGVPLWVDLKGRQLRVTEAAVPPFTAVRVSRRVKVRTPCDAFFGDGREHARVVAVDGDRLILEDGPRRVVGPGESVNIPDPSLEIEGTLTGTDHAYLAAMRELGLKRVLLSFAERPEDAAEVRGLLPEVELLLKIESLRGLAFARAHGAAHGHLVAARGDLFVEIGRPHRIVGALRGVLAADPGAIVASRLFPSLARHPVPESAELGDEICLRRDSEIAALELLAAVAEEMR
jgi:pyruvate kinase